MLNINLKFNITKSKYSCRAGATRAAQLIDALVARVTPALHF